MTLLNLSGAIFIVHAQPVFPLPISDGSALDNAGWRVATDHEWIVVSSYRDDDRGTNSGALLVYNIQNGKQVFHSKLTGQALFFDRLGTSLDMENDRIVAGSPEHDRAGRDAGSVTVFKLNDDVWTLEKILVADAPDLFATLGTSVGISGSTIITGAPGQNASRGAAYIFNKPNASSPWTLAQRLDPPRSNSLAFGATVSIDGDIAVVGSSQDDVIDVYERVEGTWTLSASLEYPGTTSEFANFGVWVDVDGPWIGTGAHGDSQNGEFSGTVFIYRKNESGEWTLYQRLDPSDGQVFDRFGKSVSINGDYLVVGADGATGEESAAGASYAYELVDETWIERSRSVASDGKNGDHYGVSVALSDEGMVAVGAPESDISGNSSGAAYWYSIFSEASTGVDQSVNLNSDAVCLPQAYPNPTQGSTHITFTSHSARQQAVYVSDVMGRIVLKTVVMPDASPCGQVVLDLSHLIRGVYLVRVGESGVFSVVRS